MSKAVSFDEFERRERILKMRYLYQFSGDTDIEIPYGWIGVIETLCAHVDMILPMRVREYFTFTQLKEKFGSGRFYWSLMDLEDLPGIGGSLNQEMSELIWSYEAIAQHTCCICGEPGRRVYGDWAYVFCQKHESERSLDNGESGTDSSL